LLVAGWSCKDLSRLSKDYAQKNNSNVLEEKRGSSGQTLEGLLQYLRNDAPPVYIGENVDEIIDVFSENRLYLISAMRGAGYVTDVVKVDSSEYGHWTKRVRAYIVAFNLEKCELSDSEAACQ
jgi:site-specific DNA-cytosine methylase